jgi:hypothetical protein
MPNLSLVLISGAPVGSSIQAPYNIADASYMPHDYRKLLRATYPKLSPCLPSIGVFTAVARTKTGTPTSSAIANNGTNWVVTGVVGTNNLYYTPDGITYTATTTPASQDIRSVLNDGTNFVAVGTGGGNPLYSSTGTGTWSVSASAVLTNNSTLQTCMTWASSLGTVGRFCVVNNSFNFHTSDDRGVTWTARNHGLGSNAFHVCWTGQKFIATTGTANVIYTSTDGITWSTFIMPFPTSAATATKGGPISDGSGKVLWVDGTTNAIYTSLDHGVTWSQRLFANPLAAGGIIALSNSGAPSYTNGRFFLPTVSGVLLVSTDLIGWAFADTPTAIAYTAGIAYKGSVYLCNVDNSTTAAYTLTEDTTYMRLPYPSQGGPANSWNNNMSFIKVQ